MMDSTSAPVLVVGGCGFLGHHIVAQLIDSHHQVSILDVDTRRNRIQNPSVSYYDGDISSFSDLLAILQKIKPHIIIHTAAVIEVARNPALGFKVNVDGTRNLLECARKIGGVKAFVYTSSASVVHDSISDLYNADERLPVLRIPQQHDLYSHTKGLAEDLVLAANRKDGILTVALRPAGIFGEGDLSNIANMVKACDEGKTRFQLGDNKNYFDFTYVQNVVQAHVVAMRKLTDTSRLSIQPSAEERVDGEAFFITNDQPLLFWNYARAIWSAAGDKTEVKDVWVIPKGLALMLATILEWMFWILFWGRKQPNLTRTKIKYSTMNRTYCIDKAKKRLGYQPTVSIEDGIVRSVQWYRGWQQQNKKIS